MRVYSSSWDPAITALLPRLLLLPLLPLPLLLLLLPVIAYFY